MLDLVEPVEMGLDDAAREPVVEEQIALAVREGRRHPHRDVDSREQVRDLVPQPPQAPEDGLVAHEIGGQQPDRRLHEDPREAGRLPHPLRERLPPLVRERVVRPGPRPPGLRPRPQVPELLEALRLGVPLALCEFGVYAALAGHPHEVVRAGPAATDEDEDDVGELGELAP